jgi:hypothetical protein
MPGLIVPCPSNNVTWLGKATVGGVLAKSTIPLK